MIDLLSTESMESEVAKNDAGQRMKYYVSVQKHTQTIILKTEDALQQMKVLGDDFIKVFEKTHKRHVRLLDKISKLIEREREKARVAPKVDDKNGKKAKPAAVKPKAPASKSRPAASE
jgi:hypothetical protein